MWQIQREFIEGDKSNGASQSVQRSLIFNDDERVTYQEVIELWQDDHSFREFFISALANTPMTAYFWETPPISKSTVKRKFEFVTINSPKLANIKPDPSDFQEYFDSATEEVTTFPNLSNDALLVVPCPVAKIPACTHIASFVRNAANFQQHSLWQTLGRAIIQKLDDQPIWVSTSGLDVSWLHVRLDSRPKHYAFEPYKYD